MYLFVYNHYMLTHRTLGHCENTDSICSLCHDAILFRLYLFCFVTCLVLPTNFRVLFANAINKQFNQNNSMRMLSTCPYRYRPIDAQNPVYVRTFKSMFISRFVYSNRKAKRMFDEQNEKRKMVHKRRNVRQTNSRMNETNRNWLIRAVSATTEPHDKTFHWSNANFFDSNLASLVQHFPLIMWRWASRTWKLQIKKNT